MKDKSVIAIVIMLLAILSLVLVYSMDNFTNPVNRTDLTVSSEGPIELSKIIDDIKTKEFYKGYDNETLAWMESLGDKKVFAGNGTMVVMSSSDASKLHSVYVCDAYIEEHFECDVLENHSLGNIKYPRDVLLVKNVKYLDEELHYLQGS